MGLPLKSSLGAAVMAVAAALTAGCQTTGGVKEEKVSVTAWDFALQQNEGKLVPIWNPRDVVALASIEEPSPNVSGLSPVTQFSGDEGAHLADLAVSPVGDGVVYTTIERSENGFIGTLNKKGLRTPGVAPVVTGEYLNFSPAFTVDGHYVLFSSNRGLDRYSLWRRRATGAGGMSKISSHGVLDFKPSPTPDGKRVFFESISPFGSLESEIWTINLDSGLLTQLAAGAHPQVSPDGRQLLFTRKSPRTGRSQIWIMSVDGVNETQLSTNEQVNDLSPSWSPDGRWIVFASDERAAQGMPDDLNVWLMAADGSRRVQLTGNASTDDSPQFLPSGRHVVFRSSRGGAWNIYQVEINPSLFR